MPAKLTLSPGAHVCHLYEDSRELKNVNLPFLVEGLNEGDSCLYVTGEESVDDWYFELQACGLDVQRERRQNSLSVIPGRKIERPDEFNSIVQAGHLVTFLKERLVCFPGVRIAVEMEHEWDPPLRVDQICHWEATSDLVFAGQNVRAICNYDLNGSPSLILAALRTHPRVIIDGQLFDNLFYEGPRILWFEPHLNHCSARASEIELKLLAIREKAKTAALTTAPFLT